MLAVAALLFLSPGPDPGLAGSAEYRSVSWPCGLEFPGDHGAHPDYKTEWWYYTGHLRSAEGRRFGFQLTFFRTRIDPIGAEIDWPRPASAWRTSQIYLAHAALSDLDRGEFIFRESAARGALNLAGVKRRVDQITVFVKDWKTRIGPSLHRLKAATDEFELDLELTPRKPPVLHGRDGYSRKGSSPERASCYYSFTRMEVRGRLVKAGETFAVEGLGWMDHEFSTAPLEPGLNGWDWFGLQLIDGSELMIYSLRQADGGMHPASSGTFVDAAGRAAHLEASDFTLEQLGQWRSPHSNAVYPARWRLKVPSQRLELTLAPQLDDQELRTHQSTGVVYWEGSISIDGTLGGRGVDGQGYAELTGYAEAFNAPL